MESLSKKRLCAVCGLYKDDPCVPAYPPYQSSSSPNAGAAQPSLANTPLCIVIQSIGNQTALLAALEKAATLSTATTTAAGTQGCSS